MTATTLIQDNETVDQMVDEVNVDTENFLLAVGANDVIHEPWGTTKPLRPLFDDYRRQDVGTLFSMPQRIFKSTLPVSPGPNLDVFKLYMDTVRSQRNMASFAGIRATLKLKVTIRSAITAYGAGLLAWYYGPPRTGVTAENSVSLLTSAHAQIFDIPSSPELLVDIPFIHNTEYLSKDVTNYVQLSLSAMTLDSIDTSIPPSVYAEVWAYLEDVEVTRYIEAQSLPIVVRPQEYNIPGRMSLPVALSAGMTIANVGSSVLTSVVSQGYTDLKKSLYSEVKESIKTAQKFEEKKDTKQKVSDNLQTPVYNSPFGNLNSLAPTSALQSMTEMPMWKIDPALYGDGENHTLADIVQNAVHLKTVSFGINDAVEYTGLSYEGLTGYAGYISEHFRFARARPRIGLWFAFSPLMSARFQIKIGIPGELFSDDDDGSVARTSLLVKGSSFHVVEIPYNHQSPVISTQEPAFEMQLKLINKGEPTTSGNVPPIRVLFFTSMGPGAQFFSVKSPDLQNPLNPRVNLDLIEAHSSTREMNRAEPDICFTNGPLTQISYMDSIDTIEELCSRWATQLAPIDYVENSLIPPSSFVPSLGNEFRNNKYGDMVQHFAPLFTLWRGSRDFRYSLGGELAPSHRPTMSNEVTSVWSSQSMANGGFAITEDSVIQFRIPCLTRYRALRGTFASEFDINPIPPSEILFPEKTTIFSRASPDFQLFHLNMLYRGYDSNTYYTGV